jgi:predicted DCC family thiol-disulfide oxidoreductase YuxK
MGIDAGLFASRRRPEATIGQTAPMRFDDRPLVIYDGECGICKWLLAGLLRWDRRGRLRTLPLQSQEAEAVLADLDTEVRMASWHLVSPDGGRRSAGAALPTLLSYLPGGRPPAAVFARFPGATERAYRWVARNRTQISKLIPAGSKARAAERVRQRERRDSNPRPPA